MKDTRNSRQKDAIRDYLKGNRSHPTADDVYVYVRQKLPNVSLATVYRNLNQMADNGELLRLTVAGGPDHFDPDITPHAHFICRECGQLYDFPFDVLQFIGDETEGALPGRVEAQELTLYGVCNECLAKHEMN